MELTRAVGRVEATGMRSTATSPSSASPVRAAMSLTRAGRTADLQAGPNAAGGLGSCLQPAVTWDIAAARAKVSCSNTLLGLPVAASVLL